MARSLPVLLLVVCTQLSHLCAGFAVALAAEPHGCCAAEQAVDAATAQVQGEADPSSLEQAPCRRCGDEGGPCADGCDDCRCCDGHGSLATPPVASAQPAYAAPPIELAFEVDQDPDTRVLETLERPPRAPA